MRALQIVAPGEIGIRDVPVPDIAADEVLVEVAGAGLCHSDLHVLHFPEWPIVPMTLGHETAGYVASVGAGVVGFSEGDPVLVSLVWACGTCRACREGRDNACLTHRGMPPSPGLGPDGGMAEYLKVPARYLEPLDSIDPTTAGPLADAGVTAYHTIDGARSRLTPGATAVVIGVGGLGHVALQILAATSAVRIVAVDTSSDKLDLARRHGADEAVVADDRAAELILEMTNGHGADAVFDFVGVQPSVTLATSVIAPDGALRFAGLGGGSFTYTADALSPIPWGVDIRRSYGGTRSDQRAVIALVAAGKLSVETQLFPLEEGPRAFAALEAGTVTGRAVLVP
jgi:propanol-preferring alcohol dehydrogenase